MNLRTFLAGATALALLVAPAFAAEYLGGAVKSADIGGKMVLTGSNDMTLYIFDKDSDGKSVCNGPCATNWPPLMASADARASGPYTVITRDDGSRQWAYKGQPLYTWVKDTKPGDITGDGFMNNAWRAAAP